jgi:hypothetical protein
MLQFQYIDIVSTVFSRMLEVLSIRLEELKIVLIVPALVLCAYGFVKKDTLSRLKFILFITSPAIILLVPVVIHSYAIFIGILMACGLVYLINNNPTIISFRNSLHAIVSTPEEVRNKKVNWFILVSGVILLIPLLWVISIPAVTFFILSGILPVYGLVGFCYYLIYLTYKFFLGKNRSQLSLGISQESIPTLDLPQKEKTPRWMLVCMLLFFLLVYSVPAYFASILIVSTLSNLIFLHGFSILSVPPACFTLWIFRRLYTINESDVPSPV